MSAFNHKKARNDEIKRLYATREYSQSALGRKYGINQVRICAILHDRLPYYHYCRGCKFRFPKGVTKSSCDSCKSATITKRIERKFNRIKMKELEQMGRALMRTLMREDRIIENQLIKNFRAERRKSCFIYTTN